MFCRNCGKEIADGDKFCQFCGYGMEGAARAETTETERASPINIVENGTASTEEIGEEKKHRIKIKWLIAAGIVIILVFWLMSGNGPNAYIELVQGGVLEKYDYGICIGDALHEWFAGTEEWDCYEEDDNMYVVVTGSCPYALTEWNETQTFYFKIMDDEHFRFLGAYTDDGLTICSTSGSSAVDEFAYSFIDWVSPLYEIDFYEQALKAAFGDEEAMDIFKSTNE